MHLTHRNTLHTPQKMQIFAEIKNIPYFLPVMYMYLWCQYREVVYI